MYLTLFKNQDDVISCYSAPSDALEGATVYLAWYGYGDYCGSSLVVFEKGGKLYEVNGGHCSCNGLEGQWEPEETSWAALAMRDYISADEGGAEATKVLREIVAEHIAKEAANGTTV